MKTALVAPLLKEQQKKKQYIISKTLRVAKDIERWTKNFDAVRAIREMRESR